MSDLSESDTNSCFRTPEAFNKWIEYERVRGNPMAPHFTYIMSEIFSLRDRVAKLEGWQQREDEAYLNEH